MTNEKIEFGYSSFPASRGCRRRDVSRVELFCWPPLLVGSGVGEELFECCQRVRVVLYKIPVHAGVGEESVDVFAYGGQFENVIAVGRFDAVGVLE